MSCTHPRIMLVADLSKIPVQVSEYGVVNRSRWYATAKKLEEKNWKINYDRKKAYRLVSKDSRELELESIKSWCDCTDLEIPCGHCIQCRLDYSKTWAIRCCHEASYYDHNYFVTLTLNEDHIKLGSSGNPTLERDALSKFMKRLRRKFQKEKNHVGVKFFGCGEYNSTGERLLNPHYHVILFNCPLDDLSLDFKTDDGCIIHKTSSCGDPLYYSKFIDDCWKDKDGNSMGFITVEDANYRTEAYVSRYILKKQGSNETLAFSKGLNVEPPFLRMSNRPAIGMRYFEDNEDYLIDDPKLIIPRDGKEPLVAGVPRFYKKKILENHPELYEGMLDKAKDNTLKSRSLIRGKLLINGQREAQEDHIAKMFQAYNRNF